MGPLMDVKKCTHSMLRYCRATRVTLVGQCSGKCLGIFTFFHSEGQSACWNCAFSCSSGQTTDVGDIINTDSVGGHDLYIGFVLFVE